MTAQPTRDQLRALDESAAALDALEQVKVRDARIADEKRLRMEATAAATRAEARIKAVENLCDDADKRHASVLIVTKVRRALDG